MVSLNRCSRVSGGSCYVGKGGFGGAEIVGGGELELHAADAGADEDCRIARKFLAYISGVFFLHADGRAPSSYIARSGQKVFKREGFHALVARYLGGLLEVDLTIAGHNAHDRPGLVSLQDDCLENPFYGLAEKFGHMVGCKIFGVNLVCMQPIGYLERLQYAGRVRFLLLHG